MRTRDCRCDGRFGQRSLRLKGAHAYIILVKARAGRFRGIAAFVETCAACSTVGLDRVALRRSKTRSTPLKLAKHQLLLACGALVLEKWQLVHGGTSYTSLVIKPNEDFFVMR